MIHLSNKFILQQYKTIKNIHEDIVDDSKYGIDSLIFDSFDKQSILEYGFFKRGLFKPGIVDKFFNETSNRLAYNFFYPLLRKFNHVNHLKVNSVGFDQVHFEWNSGKRIVSPIDLLLISSSAKVLLFLECKHDEPNSDSKFCFSQTYLNQLESHGMNGLLTTVKKYIQIYEELQENETLTYGAGISQNLRQIISIAINKGKYKKSSSPYQFHNYIYDDIPDFNDYEIWFGNLLFYEDQNRNLAGAYFKENLSFIKKAKIDFHKFGINLIEPISYKTILSENVDMYKSIGTSYTLFDYLMHNYFAKNDSNMKKESTEIK